MFEFEKPKIEIVETSDDNKYGKFVIEPLERGYGITLGNSLRRIMLSSLPGTAVSHVKIKGVSLSRITQIHLSQSRHTSMLLVSALLRQEISRLTEI